MGFRLSRLATGAAAFLPPLGAAVCAEAQTWSVSGTSAVSLGPLYSNTVSTLTLVMSTGGSGSPSGIRPAGAADATATLYLSCGTAAACNSIGAHIRIQSSGSGNNRLGPVGGLSVALGSGPSSFSGTTTGTGTGTLSFSLTPIGQHQTLLVGYSLPVLSDGSSQPSGPASVSYTVYVSPIGYAVTSTWTTAVQGTVFRPLTISKLSDMSFGKIVPPASGSGTVSLSTSGVVNAGPGMTLSSAPSAAQFRITGEGSQVFNLTVPASFILSSGSNSLVVTTVPSTGTTTHLTLGTVAATSGSMILAVGGHFPLSSTTPRGAYTGSLMVTVDYN